MEQSPFVPELQSIQDNIHVVRGVKVMLDRDLALLYGVKTSYLNERVKRTLKRFPSDFMFKLTKTEFEAFINLRSQTAISSWGGRRTLPYVFTEQGVAMLSSVLGSEMAIEVNIKIMRAFVMIRQLVTVQPEYALLREQVRRIESDVSENKLAQLVEAKAISGKVTQLSREVMALRDSVRHFSEVLDQFQDSHLIIRRPVEGVD